MPGRKTFEPKLFNQVGLEERVPEAHLLPPDAAAVDLAFVRRLRARFASRIARPGIDPVVTPCVAGTRGPLSAQLWGSSAGRRRRPAAPARAGHCAQRRTAKPDGPDRGHRTNVWALGLILAALLTLCYSMAVPSAHAQTAVGPTQVAVAVYVLSLGKLDTATGSFTVDFYMSFHCDRPCDPSEFEFMNGRATLLDKQVDEPSVKFYRIQAALLANLDLRPYPFDKHDLSIVIEDKILTTDQMVYRVDRERSGISPDVIVTGWELEGGWDARVAERHLPIYDGSFSHYSFSVRIRRTLLAALMKAVLPSLVIVMSGFLALLLHAPDKALSRVGISTSALIGAILFHLNVTSTIPPVGYLTFADRFALVNYVGLLTTLISSVSLLVVDSSKRMDKDQKALRAERISSFFVVFTPSLWLALQVLNLLIP